MTDKILPSDADAAEFRVRDANTELTDFAQRLRKAVAGAGHQADVAAQSGISLGTLRNYLSGGDAKLSNILTLARATGVRLEWLATGEGPMRHGDAAPAASAPSPPAPQASAKLFETLNMDRLADAYAAALQALRARGVSDPEPRRIMQITAIIYDELAGADPSE